MAEQPVEGPQVNKWTRGIAMHLLAELLEHPRECLYNALQLEYRGRKLAIVEDDGLVYAYIDTTMYRMVYPSRADTLPDRLIDQVDNVVNEMVTAASKFEPGTVVRITSRDPTWQRATCAEPKPGMTAKVVAMDSFMRSYASNEGRVALEFDETMLGYERSDKGPITVTYEPHRLEAV